MIGDVLLGCLGSDSLTDRIPLKSVYAVFWKLSKEEKYASLLTDLSFAEGPDVPISEELETALFRLCSSGLCTVDNPDFRYLRIASENRAAMSKVFKRHLEQFQPQEKKDIQELSTEFCERIAASLDKQ